MTAAGRHRPRPRPNQPVPSVDEIRAALDAYALHIRSLVTGLCLAPDCDEPWPCPGYDASAAVLGRAGLLTHDGTLGFESCTYSSWTPPRPP